MRRRRSAPASGQGRSHEAIPTATGAGGDIGRRYRGASSWRLAAGTSASTFPSHPSRMRRRPVDVTLPTTAAATSQRRHTSSTRSTLSGVTIASIRSWLSLVITSHASIPASRRNTDVTSTSIPTPPREAVSLVAHVSPAPPRSWIPTTRDSSSRARQASIRRFSSYGSPTWTFGRLLASNSASSVNPAEARTLTPPIPSRPVALPKRTARFPGPDALPSTRRFFGSTPRQRTLTRGLPE